MPGWKQANPLLGYWKRGCENPTAAEASIEPAIAALGERYRFQHPFWDLKYFADFALLDRKLIIEVDGDSHDKPAQKEKDLQHELAVLGKGWRVFRCSNEIAMQYPEVAVEQAVEWDYPNKETLSALLKEELAQLHRNYPDLLAVAAKRSKSRSQSALKGAARRRTRKLAVEAAQVKLGLRKPRSRPLAPQSRSQE